ncbi:hypothetical protein J6590_041768 [Homalodisca vitripennis]|nr:hypothetical protein J6590_041768 [Homalodisca vitripennis]
MDVKAPDLFSVFYSLLISLNLIIHNALNSQGKSRDREVVTERSLAISPDQGQLKVTPPPPRPPRSASFRGDPTGTGTSYGQSLGVVDLDISY